MHRLPPHRPHAAVAALLLGLLAWLPGLAAGAVVAALYEGIVADDPADEGRVAAAQDALRQVAVRATGRRAAASDPALAGLYADARRYARTFEPVGGGQVAVGFDADAVEAALARAGQPLWGRERPATLVVLVADRPGQPRNLVTGVEADERRAVERAAQLRGLPLVWPAALYPATAQQCIDDVLANRGAALRELARGHGAEGVLYGRATPAGVVWNWLAGDGAGTARGTPADGVDALADQLAAEFASRQTAAIGPVPVVVRGMADLRAYADAVALLQSLPNVRGVMIDSVAGDVARFRVDYRGDVEALRRAASSGGRLGPDVEAAGDGALHFVLQP
jgi:hypothetical protein